MGIRANAVWAVLGLPFSLLSVFYYIYVYCCKEKLMLKDKVVFITGASSGLGAACAEAFYTAGCRLVLSGRNVEKLNLLKVRMEKSKEGTGFHSPAIVTMDLEDLPSIKEKVKEVLAAFGHVDILINNAGKSYRGVALHTKLEVDKMLMDVNYFAHVEVTRAILPQMVERKTGQIVAIGSVQSRIAIPHRTSYAASKHAMQAYFDVLRSEVAQYNIGVSVVNPYYIATNLSTNAVSADGSAYGKLDANTKAGLQPEYVASKVVSCVVNRTSELTVAPPHIDLAIALRAMSPWLFFKIMERRAKKEQREMNKDR
ncbi:dehydrogenase/reductase SDR family member 7B [Aplysia californica]|uniref:Dehydrogenase/reductase SDR family member 7B n=1 Tax=Aplysia californica TaxID=6500 RepID=A0ABM0JFK4_APLCA|nr:dehydrogenase/reductase SDR family member 7B [Aplysia californica]XP_005092538.1 dehydrogenase/reductase SDR family member 7B [Aplysia californica]XP_035824128.1 dehydrogenase/reductase SDR family member 7B [Aplysia californica]XP_035824129.1 dehydrogenase/reductase SDR family member 7B [Aplysia californica]